MALKVGELYAEINLRDSGFKRALSNANSLFKNLGKATLKTTALIQGAWTVAGAASVKYNASIEQLQTSFETMTGSAEKGAQIMAEIRSLAAKTPFETYGLAEVTQLLMNYNISADEAISMMTKLGDVAQGDQQKLSRIAMAYGQMSSAGKVMLEDVKQMIEAGFNPLAEISETTGESMASLYKRISDGKVTVDEITASIIRSTSAGGKYFQSMEKQSQTLNGQLSTLKDNVAELGGSIFQPISDSLRDQVLPAVIGMVDQLKSALDMGGIDGLFNGALDMFPRLVDAGVGALDKMFAGMQKRLPKLAKKLFGQLPKLLEGAGNIVPKLTDALFNVASEAVKGLISSLPELIPSLLDGAGNVLLSVAVGITDLAGSIFSGARKALQEMGIVGLTSDEAFERLLSGYDRDRVEELKAKINLSADVNVEPPNVQLRSLYDSISDALTDGEEDTPEVIEGLKQQVTDYYQNQIDQVNSWREQALADLDTSMPVEEYNAAAAEINQKADEVVAGIKAASDATITFIDENAGKATAAVQANLGQLDQIYNSAVEKQAAIERLTGKSNSQLEAKRRVVASGGSRDEGTIMDALAYTQKEYSDALVRNEEKKQAALDRALEMYGDNTEAYAVRERQITAEFERKNAEAQQTFESNMAALWSGISQALAPELAAGMEEAASLERLQTTLQGVRDSITNAAGSAEIAGSEISATDFISNALSGLNLSDADYTSIAEALGIDEIDPAAIQEALIGKITEAMKLEGQGLDSAFGAELSSLLSGGIDDQISAIYQNLQVDSTPVANIIQASLESGLLNGIASIDTTTAEGQLALALGAFGNAQSVTIGTNVAGGIGQGMGAYGFSADAARMEQNAMRATRTAFDSHSPAQVMVPVGNDVAAGIGQGMQQYSFAADAAAIASQISAMGSTLNSAGRTVGKMLSEGLASGIRAGRSSVINAAKAVVQAAINKANATAEIHSPSRVTMQMGRYWDEGWAQGMLKNAGLVTRAASSVVNVARGASYMPRVGAASAMAAGGAGYAGGPIDYDRLAGAMANVSFGLNLDGRRVAEINARETARAQMIRTQRIARGYGR